MMRTYITPQTTSISLTIPTNYVGKRIEILLYAEDEINEIVLEQTPPKKTMADFCGILNNENYTQLKQYTEQARNE
ncbi:MAG: hypothetical protein H7331_08265 [Bacteroidia bacterium]|nr:hypothetical protein [Bacteroidia bacterium]